MRHNIRRERFDVKRDSGFGELARCVQDNPAILRLLKHRDVVSLEMKQHIPIKTRYQILFSLIHIFYICKWMVVLRHSSRRFPILKKLMFN